MCQYKTNCMKLNVHLVWGIWNVYIYKYKTNCMRLNLHLVSYNLSYIYIYILSMFLIHTHLKHKFCVPTNEERRMYSAVFFMWVWEECILCSWCMFRSEWMHSVFLKMYVRNIKYIHSIRKTYKKHTEYCSVNSSVYFVYLSSSYMAVSTQNATPPKSFRSSNSN